MNYYRPESLQAYWDLQRSLPSQDTVLLAGGTDLMPRYEAGHALPDHLVDIKQISELNTISITEQELEIGALTSIQDIHDHDAIKQEFNALVMASHEFAGPQIRHRGTLGGNICNASPAGDLLPALYAFDAQVELVSQAGKREIPIRDFIMGPGQTQLGQDELVFGVRMKRGSSESHFEKVGLRQSGAISVVNIAFVFKLIGGTFQELTIAAGSVGPTVVSLDAFSEAFLKDPEKLETHLILIDQAIAPIDDIRGSADYRRRVLKNLIRYFLTEKSNQG